MPKDSAATESRTRRSTKDATAKRKKKDPNAPKRAMSSYMHFANAQRPVVLEENPGIAFGQVGKLLGERWKALTDAEKSPYEAQAAADKKRYEQEKAAYDQQQGV